MNKVRWLRRTAFMLTIFALGMLVSGVIPTWFKLAYPTIVMWWLLVYDDAVFEIRERRIK